MFMQPISGVCQCEELHFFTHLQIIARIWVTKGGKFVRYFLISAKCLIVNTRNTQVAEIRYLFCVCLSITTLAFSAVEVRDVRLI